MNKINKFHRFVGRGGGIWQFMVLLLLASYFYAGSANAALDLELTKGVASAVPIAVVPFKSETQPPVDISAVIASDLNNSGEFNVTPFSELKYHPSTVDAIKINPWRKQNVNDVVIGQIERAGLNKYKVTYSLVDLYAKKDNSVLLNEEYTVSKEKLRALAHHISDKVYLALTGEEGIFSTKIAYVLEQNNPGEATKYSLEVSDFDGHNANPILISSQPIMSPAWSPDGTKIAYVSFETYLPQIYISDVATGKRKLITSFKGINGAPSWSPDGKKLAVALSKGSNNPNIYTFDLATQQTHKITDSWAINTEPTWAPDGKSLLFTSDRGGSPQIYQVNIKNKLVQRLTYKGAYNATAAYAPDGKNIILLHGEHGNYNVGLLDLKTGNVKDLTHSGKNQSPSISPNGKLVVFASEHGEQGVLGIVSMNGKVSLRIPDENGSVQEPAWSPYLG